MKAFIQKGATSQLVQIFIQDSSSTVGAGLTGLTSGSAGLVCYRARQDDGNAGATQLTLSAGTRGTWSSGGFVEKDSANMPGVYELGLDNAGLASGVDRVVYMLKGATNMAPLPLEIELVAFNPQNANLGLSNVSANVAQWNGSAVPAPNVAGVPIVDLKYTLGTLSPAAAGSVSPDWAQVANKTSTVGLTNTTISPTQQVASVSGSVGSVTGAVGSVTGSVGSVTGNVGGNVVGSVASVTAGVTVTTNNDKSGYTLTQAFPANFAAQSIDSNGNVAITSNVKKNTLKNGFMFVMTDSTTHAPKTGLTVTAQRSLDGAAFAPCANAPTEVANGTYVINLAAADVNGDHVMLRLTATAADDLNIEIVTQP